MQLDKLDFSYSREAGQEKVQLHQFARILRHHVKFMMMIMNDGKKIALGQDMIDLIGKAVLHLSMIWDDEDANRGP